MHRSYRRLSILFLSLIIFSLTFTVPVEAQQQTTRRAAKATPPASTQPKLIVALMIDQLRYDFLTRFQDLYSEYGFKRLTREGALFTNAHYLYVPTVTAPGHATFLTGSVPARHGIVGNEWYDRATGKRITSVSDESVRLLGGKDSKGAASPHRLIGSTIGDQLKLMNNGQSKVVGISHKDRGAILPAGRMADSAYWFDTDSGNFVSSTYYFSELPAWAQKFNAKRVADEYFSKPWTKIRPEADYARSGVDAAPYEKTAWGNKFPYTINGGETTITSKFYNQLLYTPFANELLLTLAQAAIEGEQLGRDTVTDVLAISLSANDYVGHAYGPYSHEVQDITLRTDSWLGSLFKYLDQRVGKGKYWLVLTADHGVSPAPEFAMAHRLGGGRIPEREVIDAVTNALTQKYGADKWVLDFSNYNLYLNHAAIAQHKLERAEVAKVAGEAALKVAGIAHSFTREQLQQGGFPAWSLGQRVLDGYFLSRSGDVVLISQPYYLFGNTVASHSTPYTYDTHVPVFFFGAAFKAGQYAEECSPADIAPTLTAALRLNPPSTSIGRVLVQSLK